MEIRLREGREKSVLRRHPWIFSGAIAEVSGKPEDGSTVRITNSDREFLAWGAFSSQSQIRVRIWSWDEQEIIGPDYFRTRLQQAIQRRLMIQPLRPNHAIRIVHGESDGLPGLIVDRYATTLVIQVLSCGAEYWRDTIVDALQELTDVDCIYERSDVDVRQLEGLAPRTGLLRGSEPEKLIRIVEGGLDFVVDVRNGHKTGFYLDQAANRLRVGFLAANRSVLDCFSYSGGFSANVLEGGARSLVMVDESAEALALARENLGHNGLHSEHVSTVEGNVFQVLRNYRDRAAKFDMIILDPPKFAHSAAQVEKASRGYKDINLMAFKLLNPGGYLVTFSCSGVISADLFQKIVAGAALDAGVDGKIIEHLHQNFDHPVGLAFPEGEYLKGLVVQIA